MEKLQKRVGQEYIPIAFERKKMSPFITLQHKKCGGIFQIAWNAFEKKPFCRCCDTEHNVEEKFRNKIKALVGEEYELVGPYKNNGKTIPIRHKKCGIITKMRPENFLTGTRCKLCSPPIDKEELGKAVMRCTENGFWISDINEQKITIKGKNGEEFVKKAPYILQELTRPTESDIFKNRVEILQPPISNMGKIYLEAKTCCEKYKVWIPEFCRGVDGYETRKKLAKELVNQGYLYRQIDGVYSLEAEVSDNIIIEQKYLTRAGAKIGAYYGSSLAHHLGILTEEPKKEYIVSNQGCQSFVKCTVRSTMVQVRKTFVQITDENYRIIVAMNLLMFLVQYPTYIKPIKAYIENERITYADIQPYIRDYPSSLEQIVSKMWD